MKRNIEILNTETNKLHTVTIVAEKIENPGVDGTKKFLCALSETEYTYVVEIPLETGKTWVSGFDLVWVITKSWPKERVFNDMGFPVLISWFD